MNGSGVSGGGVSLVVSATADTALREPQLEYMVATCPARRCRLNLAVGLGLVNVMKNVVQKGRVRVLSLIHI